MSRHRWIVLGALVLAGSLASNRARAQLPDKAEQRIRAALPAETANRILATIAAAGAHELPAAVLENRALELAAKGVKPSDIETDVSRHSQALERARAALARGGRADPAGDETEAAANAMSHGVDGRAVSDLAKTAPSDRPVAMPIYVLLSLVERGNPVQDALERVRDALNAGVSDEQLQRRVGPPSGMRGQGMRPAGPPASTPGAGPSQVPPGLGKGKPAGPPGNPGGRP